MNLLKKYYPTLLATLSFILFFVLWRKDDGIFREMWLTGVLCSVIFSAYIFLLLRMISKQFKIQQQNEGYFSDSDSTINRELDQ